MASQRKPTVWQYLKPASVPYLCVAILGHLEAVGIFLGPFGTIQAEKIPQHGSIADPESIMGPS